MNLHLKRASAQLCLLVAALAFSGGAPTLCAQDDELPSARADAAFDEAIEEGRDRVVLKLAEERLARNPKDAATLGRVVDAAMNIGEFTRAKSAAEARLALEPRSSEARVAFLRILRRRGELGLVASVAAPWLKSEAPVPMDRAAFDLGVAAVAALALTDQGLDKEAEAAFDAMVEESQRVVIKDAGALAALAEAYLFFGGRQGVDNAEKILIEAQEAKPADATIALRLARLYWDHKFLPGDAVEETKAALKARPNYADALQYQAAVLREWTNAENAGNRSAAALVWCLDVNGDHADALADTATRMLSDMQLDQARKLLAQAQQSEPRNLRVLSLQAAADYLAGDRAAADRGFAAILGLDPTYGECRRILASILNERRRWPECLDQVRAAAEIDPKSPRIWDDVARYSLFLAQTPSGLLALEKANEFDAYNQPWRRNMELVLDTMQRRYVAVETERFLVRVPIAEKELLKRFYGPFFDRSFDLLTAKYGFVPDGAREAAGRVTVEMFDDASDFSARTFGYVYPGFLGVCFGPLVTLNGPKALPAAMNSWARTFHHEFAHSITVGLAKGRMPRWLTEGLSTYEEIAFEQSWTRGMDRELFDALATDDLCRTGDFDVHFRGPRVIFAYFQSGLVAEMLVRRFGMPKVVDLLKAYGDDLNTEAAFQRAFGTSPAGIDKLFREETKARFADFKIQPRFNSSVLGKLDAARRSRPDDADVLVRRTIALVQNGRTADAESALAECDKKSIVDDRLDWLRAMLALKTGAIDRAESLRAALAGRGFVDFSLAYGLGQAALKAGRNDEAEARFREAVAAFPTYGGDPAGGPEAASPRVLLVKLLRGSGRTDEAMELIVEHLKHRSEDLELRKDLIAWRLSRGEKADARRLLDLHVLIDARDPKILLDRGALQLEAGDAEGAFDSADLAIEAVKTLKDGQMTRADAHVLAAKALLKVGRASEARDRLRAALEEAPAHPEAKRLEGEAAAAVDSRPTDGPEEKGLKK